MDLEQIAGILRDTAAREILPRFRALAEGDIREKRPGDLVTVADLAAEKRLIAELEAAVPGTIAMGEESVHEDPTRLNLIAGEQPVWIIDPIDGTANFARGQPAFAVIVAYLESGATQAGWIYEPLADVMIAATRGGGAWSGGARLRVVSAANAAESTGSAYGRTPTGVRNAEALKSSGRVGTLRNRGCSGLEYLDLATGVSQFSLHSRSLPWDHAAGMLIAVEAGGVARFLDGTEYDPRIADRPLMAAANRDAWQLVHDIVTES
jgi:fructose-1,6-bisphosphatase/inositol monophosphatase family enzyme